MNDIVGFRQGLGVETSSGVLSGGVTVLSKSAIHQGRRLPTPVLGRTPARWAPLIRPGPQTGSEERPKTDFRFGKVTACGCGSRNVAGVCWVTAQPGDRPLELLPHLVTGIPSQDFLSTERKRRVSKAEDVKCMM